MGRHQLLPDFEVQDALFSFEGLQISFGKVVGVNLEAIQVDANHNSVFICRDFSLGSVHLYILRFFEDESCIHIFQIISQDQSSDIDENQNHLYLYTLLFYSKRTFSSTVFYSTQSNQKNHLKPDPSKPHKYPSFAFLSCTLLYFCWVVISFSRKQ